MRPIPKVVLILIFSLLPFLASSAQDLEVHFIKVGQGDATLVVFPNGKTLMVDCGSLGGSFSATRVRNYIRTHLPAANPDIDLLVITHPDQDHYNKLQKVFGTYQSPEIKIEKIFYVGDLDDYGIAEDWITDFPESSRTRVTDQSYMTYPSKPLPGFESDGVKVLAANTSATYSAKNAMSIVLMISHGDFDVMLAGDATRDTDKEILRLYQGNHDELDVEVWKAAHHGSLATATPANVSKRSVWADAIKPEMVVFSCAWRNRHGHPNIGLVRMFADHTMSIEDHSMRLWEKGGRLSKKADVLPYRTEGMLSTSTNGNIVITSNGSTWEWKYDRP